MFLSALLCLFVCLLAGLRKEISQKIFTTFGREKWHMGHDIKFWW